MAQRVLVNGRIRTFDPTHPTATALAIEGGRIQYVGDDAGARALLADGGDLVDLKGLCVLPGLADAHMHLRWFGQLLVTVDVETDTLDQALQRVAEYAAHTAKGEWVQGRGWNHNIWGGAFPMAAALDAIAPDHPIYLGAKSGHAAWVNSAALRLAGIDRHTADPPGGEIVRDAQGNPTGTLLEEALELVRKRIPEPSLEPVVAQTRSALAEAARLGLTSLHDMDDSLSLRACEVLAERDELPLRIVKSIPLEQLDSALEVGLRSGLGSDRLRIGSAKMFADGALGPKTAWMLQGFEGSPGNTGIATTPIGALREAVMRANAGGLSCAIHAIGDRACREILDIYENANARYPGMRNRVEHLQILSPQDWERPARLGVLASMQPIHATSDMHISDSHLGERAAHTYVFRSLLDSGAVLAFGSDCPVETIDPLIGIHAAVTRRRLDGTPGPDGWHDEQRLSVEEAIRGFTYGAAYAARMESRLGTLTPGKWADMTVLAQDPLSIDPMEIPQAGVQATLVAGEFVFRGDGV